MEKQELIQGIKSQLEQTIAKIVKDYTCEIALDSIHKNYTYDFGRGEGRANWFFLKNMTTNKKDLIVESFWEGNCGYDWLFDEKYWRSFIYLLDFKEGREWTSPKEIQKSINSTNGRELNRDVYNMFGFDGEQDINLIKIYQNGAKGLYRYDGEKDLKLMLFVLDSKKLIRYKNCKLVEA